MRQLYLLSKQLDGIRHLIGILSEDNDGYKFEYKLGGKLPIWWLAVKDFPEYDKIYKGDIVKAYIHHFVPSKERADIADFLKSAGLKEYDEWELIKFCGRYFPRDETTLVEQLPAEVHRYE
jgi:hypothetical protein